MTFKSKIYKTALFFWGYYPFKLWTLMLLRFLKVPNRKFKTDLWFEGAFLVHGFFPKFKLICTKNDLSTLSIFWDGVDKGWDSQSLKIWARLSSRSSYIYDIGSNIGLYAIVAKTINNKAQVYAFEPSKKMNTILKNNIEINDLDISINTIAISNLNGNIKFFDLEVPTAVASLKLNDNLKSCDNLEEYTVEVNTFSSFIANNDILGVDLVSIDVEMNEPEVLEGMVDIIASCRPDFIVEVLNNEIGMKIEMFFKDLNYLFFEIDERTGLKKCERIHREHEVSHSFNFLICKHSTAVELELI